LKNLNVSERKNQDWDGGALEESLGLPGLERYSGIDINGE
jgi:hypothetical protein